MRLFMSRPTLTSLLARVVLPLAMASHAFAQPAPQAATQVQPQQTAMEAAVAKALQQQKAEENARLDRMPDVFQCSQMTWLKPMECTELNRQAKLNPGAPLRAYTAEGIEIVFPPGVSSAEMMHVLQGTEASALAYIQDMRRLSAHHERSAANYRRALARVNGTSDVFGAFEKHLNEPNPDILPDKIVVNVFYESTCPACEQYLGPLSDLQRKYPRLKIYLFQINNDQKELSRVRAQTGLNARIMTPAEVASMKTQGLTQWPYTMIDNPSIKQRVGVYGVVTVDSLESAIARLSIMTTTSGGAK